MVWWTKWSLTEGRSIVKQLRGKNSKLSKYSIIFLRYIPARIREECIVPTKRKKEKKKKKNTLLSLFVTTCQ